MGQRFTTKAKIGLQAGGRQEFVKKWFDVSGIFSLIWREPKTV